MLDNFFNNFFKALEPYDDLFEEGMEKVGIDPHSPAGIATALAIGAVGGVAVCAYMTVHPIHFGATVLHMAVKPHE